MRREENSSRIPFVADEEKKSEDPLGQHHEVYNAADIGEFDVSAFCIDVEQAGDVAHVLAHCRREGGGHLLTNGLHFLRISVEGCIFDAPRGSGVHFLMKGPHFRCIFCRRGCIFDAPRWSGVHFPRTVLHFRRAGQVCIV